MDIMEDTLPLVVRPACENILIITPWQAILGVQVGLS